MPFCHFLPAYFRGIPWAWLFLSFFCLPIFACYFWGIPFWAFTFWACFFLSFFFAHLIRGIPFFEHVLFWACLFLYFSSVLTALLKTVEYYLHLNFLTIWICYMYPNVNYIFNKIVFFFCCHLWESLNCLWESLSHLWEICELAWVSLCLFCLYCL